MNGRRHRHIDDLPSFSTYQRGPESQDRYCIGCGYNLRGKTGGRCPECGRPFSVENSLTFRRSDHPSRRGRFGVGRRLMFGVGALGWLCGIPLALRLLGQDWGAICCMYFIGWPILIGVGTYLILETVMPEGWSGVASNVVAGLFLGAVAIHAPVIALGLNAFVEIANPGLLFLGACTGLPTGLYRASRLT